ncbi:MAG: hypothetical protein LUH58_09030 [Lachnospiraceae bacterium]|nr:hypothetical protein [Lachnospiraceae bacterium]
MHISRTLKVPKKANIASQAMNIDPGKVNIETKKANIHPSKTNIEDIFTPKTASHVQKLISVFGSHTVFGRSDVQEVLGLQATRSSALLREMAEKGIIEPVYGRGKGKYRFRPQ